MTKSQLTNITTIFQKKLSEQINLLRKIGTVTAEYYRLTTVAIPVFVYAIGIVCIRLCAGESF